MSLKKLIAFAAFVITVTAMALGVNTSANAQGWHHGGYGAGYNHGGYGRISYGRGGGFHGGYNHVGYGRVGYFHGSGYYPGAYGYRAHDWAPGWHPGPGYVRHSWAWYNRQPVYWRHAHPYYGSPGLNIFVHI